MLRFSNCPFSVPKNLPALYLSSLCRGVTDKPWNIGAEEFRKLQLKFGEKIFAPESA